MSVLSHYPSCFLRQSLSVDWGSPMWISWLATESHRFNNLCLYNAGIISANHPAWLFLCRVWYQTLVLMLKQCFSLPKITSLNKHTFVAELSHAQSSLAYSGDVWQRSDWQTQQITANIAYILLIWVPRRPAMQMGMWHILVPLLNMITSMWIHILLKYLKPTNNFSACLWVKCTHLLWV